MNALTKISKDRIFDLVRNILDREPHLKDESVADLGWIKMYADQLSKAANDEQE